MLEKLSRMEKNYTELADSLSDQQSLQTIDCMQRKCGNINA